MELTIEGIKYTFRWCPPGTFLMGSPADEANRKNDETQHPVTLTRGFWMLETPVTQEMWESVMGKNPSKFKGAKLPVEQVSWGDSQEFVGGLNGLNVAPAGFKFSLPTEAQWEYACRAGTTTAFHFGGALNARMANFDSRATTAVGSFPANAWGLHDMHGNVWEWCLDAYNRDYSSDPATDPLGVHSEPYYVYRGGSWYDKSWRSRSASREWFTTAVTKRESYIGCRIVLVSTGNASDVVETAPQPGLPSPANQGAANLVMSKDIKGSVEQFLREQGWPSEKRTSPEQDVYVVALSDRDYTLFYIIRKANQQLAIYATLKKTVSESRRAAVMEYLTRINFAALRVGNFQMDVSEGDVQFRVGIDVEHGTINPAMVKQLTFTYAIGIADLFFPGIKEIEEGRTPEDVLRRISN